MSTRESSHYAQLLQQALSGRIGRRDLIRRAALLGLSIPAMNALLAACGGAATTPETTTTATSTTAGSPTAAAAAAGQPVKGGKVTMAVVGDAFSFDPPVPTDNASIWPMLNIYDQLVRVAPDGISVEPALAESWEASQDGKTYTFKLRDAKFQDNTPVTAEDVIYSIDRTRKSAAWSFLFSAFDTLTAKDDKTVVLQLKQPWAPVLADLSLFAASVLPQHAVEKQGDNFFNKPFGSGPFYMAEWAKGDHQTLKRNQYYWGKDQPYLDEVDFQIIGDDNTRMLKLQSGDIDIVADVPFNQIEAMRQTQGIVVQSGTLGRFDFIAFNHTKAPFDDVNVRKAINYAVDKEEIIKTVLFGNADVANAPLPQMLYWNKDNKPYPYDVNKAKEYLAKSKVPNGFDTELLINAGDSVGAQDAVIVQNNLKEIGINVSVKQIESATLYSDYHQKYNYQMDTMYYTTDIIDPDELIAFAVDPEGGNDAFWTGYRNPKIHELSAAAETELDPKKREDLYHQMQQISFDDAELLYLYYPKSRTGLRDWVQGFNVLLTGNYRMWEVWTTKKA